MNGITLWFRAVILSILLLFCGRAGATGYTLTINVTGSGTVKRNPTNSIYPSGVTVTLTAIPQDSGWQFSGWSGDATGTNNPINVLMDSNKVITATFQALAAYHLTLATNGQGAISLNPSGGVYISNTVVTVTATPAAGWVFDSWSGDAVGNTNPLSILVNADKSVTGNFAQLPAFDVQPQSVTNTPGGTADFTAHAVGTPPVSYQWFFNSNSLTNATNSALILTNLTLADAGSYQVVAANDYGSVTSSVVALVLTNMVGSSNVLNVCSEAALSAAIQKGGWISVNCSGTITLTNTLNITNDVILDATGVSFAISGGNAMRLFYVVPSARLSATNLTLENGIVTNNPADGGAIYNDGGTVTLVSCVLTNNSAQALGDGGIARGGAIFNNGGTLSIDTSSLSNNAVVAGIVAEYNGGLGFGGAVFSTNGSVAIASCIVNSNLCTAAGGPNGGCFGGSVFLGSGSGLIWKSSFADNLALGGASPPQGGPVGPIPAYGGALATISGNVVIDLSQFAGNMAKGGDASGHTSAAAGFGGAVYSTSALTVESSSFSGNQALPGYGAYPYNNPDAVPNDYGGGLYNAGAAILDRCSIYSNYVQGGTPNASYALYSGAANGGNGLGGGIFNASAIAITNCTFALNSAVGGIGTGGYGIPLGTNGAALGGGLFNAPNATATLMNDTIASNNCVADLGNGPGDQGTNGLAAGVQIANTNGILQLYNTIIAYGGTNGNAYGVITDNGYNISSDGSANFQSGASYNFTDPKLGPLGNYGGPTLCMALLSNSPAIDFGGNVGAPNTDQRGYPRPNNGVDIGAYEFYSSSQNRGPQLSASPVPNGEIISYTAPAFVSYCLQISTNLTSWTDLATNGPYLTTTNVTRLVSVQSGNRRFFRLLLQ